MRSVLRVGVLCACALALSTPARAQSALDSRRQQLQDQLNQIESQIAVQQSLLDKAQNQHQTLQTQIDAFNAQIRRTELQIQAISIAIQQLSDNISAHNQTLSALSGKLAGEKESLAQILRQTQVLDGYSAVTVAFGAQDVSGFFSDLDAFASIKSSLAGSFVEIRKTSAATESEKEALEARLAEQEQLKTVQQLARQSLKSQETEKKTLLAQTKGIEANYQRLIAANQKTAAQIRSALFLLRDSAAIPFGTALAYAQAAEKATGVRAAVTLGVLKQETNLGENLGTGSWHVDMAPTRDQPIFVYITQTLGLDPDKMPVSKKPSYGWGGAMGPGQFIPSTWICFGGFVNTVTNSCSNRGGLSWNQFYQGPWRYAVAKDRVRTLLGASAPSNPWEAKTAIMATAMLMADNGAGAQTHAAERLAALRYFAGWGGANNPAYAFYGDAVMEFADEFQQQINILNGS